MDRQIVYPGAIPLETDLLNTNKYALIGLAKLSSSIMGASTYFRGLECTPSDSAAMTIDIAKGEIYSLQNIDGTAYSSINADTTNSILKQGIILSSTSFSLSAPETAGQSINYLVQVTYSDIDSGAAVLPYYNTANPTVAYSGPAGSSAAQNTVRSGVCSVSLKQGVAALTGTQATPLPDEGYNAAWIIAVAQGETAITAANISVSPDATFLPAKGIVDAAQSKVMTHGVDTGATNAYSVNFSPAITALTDGMELTFLANSSNTAGTTLAVNSLSASPLVNIAGLILAGGEIVSGGYATVKWNAAIDVWMLINSTGIGASLANLGLSSLSLQGGLLGIPKVYTTSGTYTPTSGTRFVKITLTGGGGGGGGANATTTSQSFSGGGGGAGATVVAYFTLTGVSHYAITVGKGGAGASNASAATGGTSSFAGLYSALGGEGAKLVSVTRAAGGSGGIAAGGVINIDGGYGNDGQNGAFLLTANGGSSYWGGGGRSSDGVVGLAGVAFGSGGGGAYDASLTGTAFTGGAGKTGIVVIEEYA
ncbi:phage tail protein [Rouxiella sp. WC2420]|uniref:Phage tail protein n=1 Tax=Rouxiella sp. WC2420 TaxID=3234145 RepID=A0AB39VLH0_9GAMM